jgi:hypothetical protein
MSWSLPAILAAVHQDIERRLSTARQTLGHPTVKGDASQAVWLDVFKTYLPRRYEADTAHVVDSEGTFSEQIDAVIFDRQYSPFIFHFEGQAVVPAESVYAAFEAKQTINAAQVRYAQGKVASVRRLHRTSLPIPYAAGVYDPKPLAPIIGGLLTLESDWSPALGQPLADALADGEPAGRLDVGCVAAHGTFAVDPEGRYSLGAGGKPATAFLLDLIARLQATATVPMIDIRAYAKWLS